jgi:phage I-like protein
MPGMTLQARHFQPLSFAGNTDGEAAAVPARIQLLPSGVFSGIDGRGPYRVTDMTGLIAASTGPIIIDINHATDLAAVAGLEAPAVGRVTGLVPGEDGSLWAEVIWGPRGEQALKHREYWGISPVFDRDEAGTVLRLLRASLTNIPNLRLAALNSRAQPKDDPMPFADALRTVFGLDGKADEAALLAHARLLTDRAATHGRMAKALNQPEDATTECLMTALNAARPQPVGEVAEVRALQSQLDALRAERTAEQVTAAVDGAIAEGRALPGERETLVALCAASGIEKFRAAMQARAPALPPPARHRQQPDPVAGEDAGALGRRAAAFRAQQQAKGIALTITQAVAHCQKHPEAGQ